MEDTVSIRNVKCNGQTEKAIHCTIEGKPGQFWFPKSAVHDDSEVWQPGQTGTLVVLEWIAKAKGLA